MAAWAGAGEGGEEEEEEEEGEQEEAPGPKGDAQPRAGSLRAHPGLWWPRGSHSLQ